MKTSKARVLATGFYLLEGPRWFNDELLVSDIYGRRVIRFTSPENGDFETLCLIPEQPSGLGFALDGTLRIVSMLDRKLLKWYGIQTFQGLYGAVEPVKESEALGGFR